MYSVSHHKTASQSTQPGTTARDNFPLIAHIKPLLWSWNFLASVNDQYFGINNLLVVLGLAPYSNMDWFPPTPISVAVFLRPQRNLESIDPQFTIRRKMEQMREEKELVEQLREVLGVARDWVWCSQSRQHSVCSKHLPEALHTSQLQIQLGQPLLDCLLLRESLSLEFQFLLILKTHSAFWWKNACCLFA